MNVPSQIFRQTQLLVIRVPHEKAWMEMTEFKGSQLRWIILRFSNRWVVTAPKAADRCVLASSSESTAADHRCAKRQPAGDGRRPAVCAVATGHDRTMPRVARGRLGAR